MARRAWMGAVMTSEQIENGAQAIYAANHYASGTSWNDLDERQQGFYRVQFLAALAYIREQATSELIGIAYMDDVRVVCNEDIFALLSPPPAKEQK
jgi:hypothetical protein